MPLLEIKELTLQFGGLTAIKNFSFHLEKGEILGLIGPNGAGKTCVFNCISGFYIPTPTSSIVFDGQELQGMRPYKRTALGIARTFQNLRLFPNLSAEENVMSGTHCRTKATLFDSMLHLPSQVHEEKEIREKARHWLEFVGLGNEARRQAKNLSYGQQRRLEIARAMAIEPKMILLDEPAAGLNPNEKLEMIELFRKIRSVGVTPFLIDHDMAMVMNVCERLYVLDHGEKLAEGAPAEIRDNPAVIEAYLGKEEEEA